MESQSFRAVYDAYAPLAERALRRLGVREADVPDALQDVFIVVHRKLPSFEGRAKVSTWVYGICIRVARDRARLAHHRRHVADGDRMFERVDHRVDIVRDAEQRQALDILQSILEGVPSEQRSAYCLFEMEGLTGDQIAEELDVPVGTVYSRLRMARAHVQRCVRRFVAHETFALAA